MSTSQPTSRIPLGARLGGIALAVVPIPRGPRWRLRMRHPAAARAADRLADRTGTLLIAAVLLLAIAAAVPRTPGDLPRVWLAGTAVLLLTGVPFALERRALRCRTGLLPPLGDPLAGTIGEVDPEHRAAALDELQASRRRFSPGGGRWPTAGDSRPDGVDTRSADVDERALHADASRRTVSASERTLRDGDPAAAIALLDAHLGGGAGAFDADAARLRALVGAWFGDRRSARAFALRSVQIDPRRWNDLVDTASLLALRGRFTEAIRLADLAVELAGEGPAAKVALAQVLAQAGRLRDAVHALDRAEGREKPLLPPERRRRTPPPGG